MLMFYKKLEIPINNKVEKNVSNITTDYFMTKIFY